MIMVIIWQGELWGNKLLITFDTLMQIIWPDQIFGVDICHKVCCKVAALLITGGRRGGGGGGGRRRG